jgi:GTPase SAR1 family protein
LQDAGHEVWQDVTALVGGSNWQESIVDGIKRAYAMVLIMSEESNESHWVNEEFLYAMDLKRPIIPIKIDECEIPFGRRGLHISGNIGDLISSLPASPSLETDDPDKPPADIPLPESEKSQRQLEEEYLAELFLKYRIWQKVYTPLGGVGTMRVEEDEDKTDIEIADIGIEMDTLFDGFLDERLKGQPEHIKTEQHDYDNILKALDDMRQLVVLGDPGAGKSTTIWRITADYAERAQKDSKQAIPVLLKMGEVKGEQTVEAYLQAQLGELGRYYDDLMTNKRLILLFDGLNELPREHRADHAEQVKTLIEHCQERDMIAVVTCRALDYIKDLEMGITEKLEIAELDPIRIQQFVNAYITKPEGKGDELFWSLAGQTAQKMWEDFEDKVNIPRQATTFWLHDELPEGKTWGKYSWDKNSDWKKWLKERQHPRNMMTLARNPFMLFMMTKVFTKKGEIPKNRGELFGLFADFMLQREKVEKASAESLKGALANLAFDMQKQGEGTAFNEQTVKTYVNDTQLYSARSASILSEGEPIRFTHQLLQEYFAALRLDIERQNKVSATEFWKRGDWWIPNEWNETAILLAGLYGNDASDIILWLADATPELTARCVIESGATVPDDTLLKLREKWKPRLTDLQSDPNPLSRAAIGRGLGLIDRDNRVGVSVKDGLPDIDWVLIPDDGDWTYQDGKHDGLPAFTISRYAITYGQFQSFVDAPDYEDDRWWTGLPEEEEAYGTTYRTREISDQMYKFGNHPREMVSWYQSIAFCRWLSHKLWEVGTSVGLSKGDYDAMNPSTWLVRLPTEYEWEKAARGKTDWAYPYSDEFDANKGNTSETGIGQTSAVGIFPDGASPYGVLDMSGNVWEWCLTDYENPAKDASLETIRSNSSRVLRGGGWALANNYARSAYRFCDQALDRDGFSGFRVCSSPFSEGFTEHC